MSLHVCILGAGSFGQGLAAVAAARKNKVSLWSRSGRSVDLEGVTVTSDLADAAQADLLMVAVPSQHVSSLAEQLGGHLDGRHLVVHVSRGLVGPELTPITDVIRHLTPARRLGAIAGPLVPQVMLSNAPTGAVIGTRFSEVAAAVRQAIAGPTLRVYETDDLDGVQIASATVGLLVVTMGIAAQAGFGPGALAVLATRGMFEAARIGETLGAKQRTFMGLAGFGDVIAAVSGDDRPEFALGKALAKGQNVTDALVEAGAFVEGTTLARRLIDHAARFSVDVPITATLLKVIEGEIDTQGALRELMAVQVRTE